MGDKTLQKESQKLRSEIQTLMAELQSLKSELAAEAEVPGSIRIERPVYER